MNNNNTKSIKILDSRCLEATLINNEKVVLNPQILVSYYEDITEIKLKGAFEEYAEISLADITEIDGVAFSGTFTQLRTAIDALVIAANYTDSSGTGGITLQTLCDGSEGLKVEVANCPIEKIAVNERKSGTNNYTAPFKRLSVTAFSNDVQIDGQAMPNGFTVNVDANDGEIIASSHVVTGTDYFVTFETI